jgi:hypothetical protein
MTDGAGVFSSIFRFKTKSRFDDDFDDKIGRSGMWQPAARVVCDDASAQESTSKRAPLRQILARKPRRTIQRLRIGTHLIAERIYRS